MAMRKRVWMPLALLALGAVGFFGVAPGYLEASMNKIDGQPGIPVSEEAKALHKTLQIVDLHSDTLMWQRSLLDRADRVLVEHRLPAFQVRAFPVAVGAAHVGRAVAGDLGQDHLDLGRRGVVGVDQQRNALFFRGHGHGRDSGAAARPSAPA